jgi:hypothetical protein
MTTLRPHPSATENEQSDPDGAAFLYKSGRWDERRPALPPAFLTGRLASRLRALLAPPVCTRSMHVPVRPSVAAFDRTGGVAGTKDTTAFGPCAVARSWRYPSGVGRADEPANRAMQGSRSSPARCASCRESGSSVRRRAHARIPRSTHVIGRDWVFVDARFRTRPRVRLARHGTGGQRRLLVRSDRLPAFVTRLRVGRV